MKKSYIFIAILLIIAIIASFSYHSGTPVEDLKEKYTYAESGFIEFEKMQIHYRKTGNGPVLFLMHGVSSSLHTWEKWHDILSKDFTVISIDVPSFGLTGPHPKDDYSVEMYMRAIDYLALVLQIDTMYIAGNSFGGYLAWNYALHNKDLVKKVILLDAAGNEIKKFKDFGFKMMANKYTTGFATRFTPKLLIAKSLRSTYGNPSLVDDDLIDRYYDLLLREGNRKGFAKILQTQLKNGDLTNQISQVSQPTLIIWGREDHLFGVEDAEAFKNNIKNSTLKIYDGVGHIPMEEIPEETALLTKEFLLK